MNEKRGPLDGVRAIACSTAQAGAVPYALMADLGAEVIKIETPGTGDPSRNIGVLEGFPSVYFETNNRGVKSLTLNLKSPEGKKILYELVKGTDVFGQNFRPGAAEKNGFGYEDIKKANPRIVYVSVSGYGSRGPHAALPGYDSMGQALGGIAEAFSTPGHPFKTGVVSVADETCAILTFGAIVTGLYCARMTGVGQKIDSSLLGGQIRLMGWTLTTAVWTNKNPITGQARISGSAKNPGLSVSFNDKNGKPFVFQLHNQDWQPGMTALGFYRKLQEKGLGELVAAVSSAEKREEMLRVLGELFATGTREKWVEILRSCDIVSAPINTLLEAASDPDVLANEYLTEVDYPKFGKRLKVQGSPWQFSETPIKIGIAPELGEHNVPILKGLGYTDAQIQELKEKKVI
jgi:crotonobetainyl-CoA:carnitine CoA-transferase CaiB-like acyl-CoA transferase